LKRNLVLLVCLLAGSSAMAEARQLSIGGRIGISSATIGGEDTEGWNLSRRTGVVTAVQLRTPFAARISLQPELLVSQRGATVIAEFSGETFVSTLEQDYVEMPLLVRYEFPFADAAVQPAVFAGPMFAFEARCKTGYSFRGESDTSDCIDNRNKLDFGIVLGGGLDFPMAFGTLLVDARHTLGLRKLYGDSQDPPGIKHRVWSLSAGIARPVGAR
jgi:hypothetical protein